MLGPLPQLYRVIVTVTALVIFIAGGAWAAFMLPYPILVSAGASVGLTMGVLCAYLLLHEPHRATQSSRARRTRLR
ncbi:MAG: hypothetical protein ACRDPJ_21215 [Nocardioidaceae bacterium]